MTVVIGTAAALVLTVTAGSLLAAPIAFENPVGPSSRAAVWPSETSMHYNADVSRVNVRIQDGLIVDQIANLLVNPTTLYGAEFFFGSPSLRDPFQIDFFQDLRNFPVDVIDGLTTNVDYWTLDNLIDSATFNNGNSGGRTIFFAAGGNVDFIESPTSDRSQPDFFIDDLDLPGVPDPVTLALLGLIPLLGFLGRRRTN